MTLQCLELLPGSEFTNVPLQYNFAKQPAYTVYSGTAEVKSVYSESSCLDLNSDDAIYLL